MGRVMLSYGDADDAEEGDGGRDDKGQQRYNGNQPSALEQGSHENHYLYGQQDKREEHARDAQIIQVVDDGATGTQAENDANDWGHIEVGHQFAKETFKAFHLSLLNFSVSTLFCLLSPPMRGRPSAPLRAG